MPLIPVSNLLSDGSVADHPWQGAPCIALRYSLRAPEIAPDGRASLTGIKTAWALIDTGADFNLAAPELLVGARQTGELITNSGVAGEHLTEGYHITFHIPEADHMHSTGIIALPQGWERPYQIILGRKFLQMVRFQYDGHLGIVSLEYFENPQAV